MSQEYATVTCLKYKQLSHVSSISNCHMSHVHNTISYVSSTFYVTCTGYCHMFKVQETRMFAYLLQIMILHMCS